ncbi:MAG: hypothetical protein NC181_03690 [Clostridium sp.]|nr:hypothetical protein [Clostridium sp.]MCM1444277.1 hypothetical protein [Candidatus Amulumruptor caecigallinarius]
MIGVYLLTDLLKRYNINANIVVNNNGNILNYGEYTEINKVLDYLINELKINQKNIEKCPSILYLNVNAIKRNVNFIKNENISFNSIEVCLHVLSTEPLQLKATYDYIKENYGTSIISKITSILAIPVDRIKSIEQLNIPFINKGDNLSVAVGINSIEDIQKITESKEFKDHPELFTSTTLAQAKLEDIQKIIQSEEFKKHPELFTSQVLAQAKLEDIQKIIQSKEFKEYPDLFTSQVLAHAKLEDIQKLLSLSYWREDKYKNLLTPSIVANSKKMIDKLPKLIVMAEYYNIDRFINISFLIMSPSQNYAIIKYLLNNNIDLIINSKLNPIFSYRPGYLKKNYGIDLKTIMLQYPYNEEEFIITTAKGKK